MRIPPILGHWFVISMCLASTPAFTQEHHKDHSAADLNRQFQDPNLDVQKFVRQFETDLREIFAQRQAIVQAVDLRPGLAVADIGAGTGLFTWMFAEEVGPKGTVYAVEIAPAFLKSIGEQARQRGLEKVVKTVRSTQEATNLAPGSIDVAFVCATYHHFEHPEKVLASIHQAHFDPAGGSLSSISISTRTAVRLSANGLAPERGVLPGDRGCGLRAGQSEVITEPEGELLRGLSTTERHQSPRTSFNLTPRGGYDEAMELGSIGTRDAVGRGGDGRRGAGTPTGSGPGAAHD